MLKSYVREVSSQDSAQDTPYTKFSAQTRFIPSEEQRQTACSKKAGVLVLLEEWDFKEKGVVCARVGW